MKPVITRKKKLRAYLRAASYAVSVDIALWKMNQIQRQTLITEVTVTTELDRKMQQALR